MERFITGSHARNIIPWTNFRIPFPVPSRFSKCLASNSFPHQFSVCGSCVSFPCYVSHPSSVSTPTWHEKYNVLILRISYCVITCSRNKYHRYRVFEALLKPTKWVTSSSAYNSKGAWKYWKFDQLCHGIQFTTILALGIFTRAENRLEIALSVTWKHIYWYLAHGCSVSEGIVKSLGLEPRQGYWGYFLCDHVYVIHSRYNLYGFPQYF